MHPLHVHPFLHAVMPLLLLLHSTFATAETYAQTVVEACDFPPNGEFTLSNVNGSISVRGYDGTQLQVKAIKQIQENAGLRSFFGEPLNAQKAQEILEAVRISVRPTAEGVSVNTLLPKWNVNANLVVDYEIQVPAPAQVKVSNNNGAITLEDLSGGAEVETANGRIEFWRVTGGVKAITSNGAIVCKEWAGPLQARTTNGAIHASRDDVPKAEEDISCVTSNGAIRLTLPADAAFALSANTNHGAISCAHCAQSPEGRRNKSLTTTVGTAGPQITLQTRNGSIHIEKQ